MKFTIPKRFKLFDQWIDVKWNKKLLHNDDCLGMACYRDNKIELQPQLEGRPIKKSQLDQTFFHELTHQIFHAIDENELRTNEKIVNQVGKCLYNFFDTKEGRL